MADLFGNVSRDERQAIGVQRWVDNKLCGSLVYCTGFGKTRTAIMCMKRFLAKNPGRRIIIVVPTDALQRQWLSDLTEQQVPMVYEVLIINSVVKHEWTCDLLVLDECHKYGIEPVITLSHFELPWALAKEYGGFRNRQAIDMFVKFAKVCFERYQHKVKYWMTFNEINNQADVTQHNLIQEGAVLLQEGDDAEYLMYLSAHHELVASALAVKAAHEINPDLQVGCMIGMNGVYPASPKPEDVMNALGAMHQKYWYVEVHARGHYPRHILKKFERKGYDFITEEDKKILAEGKVDYIGFSYYMSFATKYQGRNEKTFDYVPEDFVRNTYLKASDWGWQIDPLGLRWCLNWFNDRFELPMMIVENGFGAYDKKEADGTVDDQYRIDYLKEHIQAMKDAVEYDGVDLLGYTMWSPIDIVSASTGEYDKRYGFIYVNYNNNHEGDFSRSKKKSFDWYKHVIETNGACLFEQK